MHIPIVKISIFNEQEDIPIRPVYWRRLVKEVASKEGEKFFECSLHFVDSATIAKLHNDFFNDPSLTDCITFPIDGPGVPCRVLGEVFICPAVAVDYAASHGEHPLKETALYVVHGLLHLFGYDDIKVKERRLMKGKEKELMAYLSDKGYF